VVDARVQQDRNLYRYPEGGILIEFSRSEPADSTLTWFEDLADEPVERFEVRADVSATPSG
jgi:hypothetical protein